MNQSSHWRRFSREWPWRLTALAAAGILLLRWEVPLVQIPGMGTLNLLELSPLPAKWAWWVLLAAGLLALPGWGRPAGVAAGMVAGALGSIGLKQWENLERMRAMNAEMLASGSTPGDLGQMLEVRVLPGSWLFAALLLILIAACLGAGWTRRRDS